MKTINMKKTKFKYSIVYSSDCVEYANDGSYEYETYHKAKLRLENMEDKKDLTIIKYNDDYLYYRDGLKWIKIS